MERFIYGVDLASLASEPLAPQRAPGQTKKNCMHGVFAAKNSGLAALAALAVPAVSTALAAWDGRWFRALSR